MTAEITPLCTACTLPTSRPITLHEPSLHGQNNNRSHMLRKEYQLRLLELEEHSVDGVEGRVNFFADLQEQGDGDGQNMQEKANV